MKARDAENYTVDRRKCVGCGACSTLLPGVFSVERGACRVLRPAYGEETLLARAAALNCPTHAIHRGEQPSERTNQDSSLPGDLFAELATLAESVRWSLSEIPWSDIEPARAPEHLRALVREMAFSEHATYSATQRFLHAFYDDIALSQWIAIWFYEESRHPHVLMEWLRRLGDPVAEGFVQRGRVSVPFMKSKMGTLVTNVISEVAAAHAYDALARLSTEPVLGSLARRISGDEARHASSFYRFARERLRSSQRPDRERLDGLKVLHFWISGRDQVAHPVNQMLTRLGADESRVSTPGFTFEGLEARVVRLVGLLLDVDVADPRQVDAAVRELVSRVHEGAKEP